MAIKNASDLLVYKTVIATTQVTRILFKATPTSVALGNLIINNVTDGASVESNVTTGDITAHTATQACTVCKAALEGKGYTVTAIQTLGTSRYIDCTNGAVGNVSEINIISGTSTLDLDKVTLVVTTSGLDAGQEPIAHSTSASISFSADLRDITTKDSLGWQENLGGLKSFELSTDALVDLSADLDFQEFWYDYKDLTEVTVRFAERVTGGSDRYWEGNAYITSLSIDAGVEENATYSVSFTGTGVATTGED